MGRDTGRRIAILLFAGCFALLCALYMGRDVVRDTFMPGFNMLENDSLLLTRTDAGIRIDGVGRLSRKDLDLLLLREEQTADDVANLFIGDGITELGHDVLRSAKSLKTLWLGRNLAEVRHGAVSLCPRLQFVYVPAGLRSAGDDFLAGCEEAIVVTGGTADQLSGALDASRFTVLEEIRSAEALERALNIPLDYSFSSASLFCTDPDAGTSPMLLRPGQIQFGPYVSLAAGDYRVEYTGGNLDALAPHNLDVYSEGTNFPVTDCSVGPNSIQFSTVLNKRIDKVEFRAFNVGQEAVEIERIDVHRTDLERAPFAGMWQNEQG